MNDIDISIHIFAVIDDIIKSIEIDPKPGPVGRLTESEILTLMVLHPVLKPFCDLKRFYNWISYNFKNLFPDIPEYSRITRLFNNNQEYLIVVMQKLADLNSFGAIADGTTISVMEAIRGKYAKSFRNGRKVYSTSKKCWYFGFLLEIIIDSEGKISHVSVGKEAEVRQLQNLLEDLRDKWLLCDRGNRNAKEWQRFWEDKQIKVKITGGKERQWIENVFGYLKTKLGLDKIRVRKMSSFLSRLFAILCCYNLILTLDLAI
jgi:glycosyltransferase involved in cell wall biosynthesis